MRLMTRGTNAIQLRRKPEKDRLASSPSKGVNVNKSIENLLDGFNDRMRNPLTFAFLVSWCVYNWQAISLWFADDLASAERIQEINTVLSKEGSIGYPVLYAGAYVLVMPLLLVGVNAVRRYFENWDKRLARKNDLGDATDRRKTADQELARARAEFETAELEDRKSVDVRLNELEKRLKASNSENFSTLRNAIDMEVEKVRAEVRGDDFESVSEGAESQTGAEIIDRLSNDLEISKEQAEVLTSFGISSIDHVRSMDLELRGKLAEKVGIAVVDRIEQREKVLRNVRTSRPRKKKSATRKAKPL